MISPVRGASTDGSRQRVDEVLNSQRCVVAEELDDDVTVVSVDSCLSSCISHGSIVARGGAHSPSNMFFRPGRTVGRAFGRELNILRGEHYARGGVFWLLAHFNRWRSPHVLLQEA